MLKKLMVAGVVFAMLFSFSACNEVTLKDYKEAAKIKLEAYAESKGKSNYSEDSWEEIWNIVTEGKAMIGAATDKPTVDSAISDAKTAINAVEREEISMGKFYTLQEAFAKGFLTKNDLMHISHFATGRVVEVIDVTENMWAMELDLPDNHWTKIKIIDFTPKQAEPTLADLSESRIADMKVAFYEANKVLIDDSLQLAISDGTLSAGTMALQTIIVQEFLGTYNGFYAVRITSTLWGYGGAMVEQLVSDIGWSLPSAPMITVFAI